MIKKSFSFNSSDKMSTEFTTEVKKEVWAGVTNTDAINAIISKKQSHLLSLNGENTSLESVWGSIVTSSPAKQVVIGGVSGWCTGYVAGKIGKIVLIVIGGSLIALQLAQSQGLVQIDWDAVESRVSQTRNKMKQHFSDKFPSLMDQVKDFGMRHMYLSGSFCLGLLFGVCG